MGDRMMKLMLRGTDEQTLSWAKVQGDMAMPQICSGDSKNKAQRVYTKDIPHL